MMQEVPGWFERLLQPRLSSIEGEIKGMRGEAEGFRAEVRGQFEAVHSEIGRFEGTIGGLDDRTDSLRNELLAEIDVVQSLAVVEARLNEYEQKSGG